MTETVKGPIKADDVFLVTGRGHIFAAHVDGVSESIETGDVVRFTANTAAVATHEYFDVDSTYKVRGIEVARTLMNPPKTIGLGFLVSKVEVDPSD